MGDRVFEYCMNEACCAPLEKAAAALACLGAHLIGPPDVSMHATRNVLAMCSQCA